MDIKCPECGIEITVENPFGNIGEDYQCHFCSRFLELNYNERVIGEEEVGQFYFEVIC